MYKLRLVSCLCLPLLVSACLADSDFETDDPRPSGSNGKADHDTQIPDGPASVSATVTTEGCGAVGSSLSADSVALTLDLDDADARRTEEGDVVARDCRAFVDYQVEPGWRMKLPYFDVSGWVMVEGKAAELTLTLSAGFAGGDAATIEQRFASGFDDSFLATVPGGKESVLTSSCDGTVRLELGAAVDPSTVAGPFEAQIESFDIAVEWERCP